MLVSTCGILPVQDLSRTCEFYTALGFKETGRWDTYLIMVQDEVEVHFAQNPDNVRENSQSAIYIRTENVDVFSARAADLDVWTDTFPRFRAAKDESWGMREVHILDPDGNLLRIGQFM